MRAALAARDFTALPDVQAHCVAAGLIAQRCSLGEAWLASIGKEIQDAFSQGAASWRDLRADRQGVRCAARSPDVHELEICCLQSVGG
jgi:hypothetical protein